MSQENNVKNYIPGKNGGRLNVGGTKGNSGGKKGRSGRTPNAIREAMRVKLSQRIKVLTQIADGFRIHTQTMPNGTELEVKQPVDIADQLRAVDILAKYGLGTTNTVTDTEGNDPPARMSQEEIKAEVKRIMDDERVSF